MQVKLSVNCKQEEESGGKCKDCWEKYWSEFTLYMYSVCVSMCSIYSMLRCMFKSDEIFTTSVISSVDVKVLMLYLLIRVMICAEKLLRCFLVLVCSVFLHVFSAAASVWRCASVSSHRTRRLSSCVWPAGTCVGLRPLAQHSSPLTPKPRWPCCSWTPAASPLS